MPCRIPARSSKIIVSARLLAAVSDAARRCACRRLEPAERDDCVIEFVELICLHHREELARRQRGTNFDAWLHRCAHNHVEDCRRCCVRRDRRETPWPEYADETGTTAMWEPAAQNASCDAAVLRGECEERVTKAAQQLAPVPHALFLRHYLHGETLTELAAATGKTPDAIRMTLARACKQVRALLEKDQMTEADAEEYLAAIRRGGEGVEATCASSHTRC